MVIKYKDAKEVEEAVYNAFDFSPYWIVDVWACVEIRSAIIKLNGNFTDQANRLLLEIGLKFRSVLIENNILNVHVDFNKENDK